MESLLRRHDTHVSPHAAAENAVAWTAPSGWYDDLHGRGKRPRCCEAVACVETTLASVDAWTDVDAREEARIVVAALEGLDDS